MFTQLKDKITSPVVAQKTILMAKHSSMYADYNSDLYSRWKSII